MARCGRERTVGVAERPKLLASGRVRWINLEERRNGHRPAPGWCDPQKLQTFLTDHGFLRIADYNRHATHQDVIYVHKEEGLCSV